MAPSIPLPWKSKIFNKYKICNLKEFESKNRNIIIIKLFTDTNNN